MSLAQKQHTNNIVIGAGEHFLDMFDAAGAKTGERYLGDAVGGSLSVTSEETTVSSGTGAVATDLVTNLRAVARSFSINLHDITPENQSLFIVGEVEGDPITATAVADEEFLVFADRWFQLGVTGTRPAGVNKVGSVTVAGGTLVAGVFTAAVGTWAANVDYVVDEDSGRIYVLPTAKTKVANAAVQVDYTPVAQAARRQVKASNRQQRGAYRYIEDAAAGKGRNFYAPVALVSPGGDSALADGRSSEQQLQLNVRCQEPGGAVSPVYIDEQPV